jgi:hypothetical protein
MGLRFEIEIVRKRAVIGGLGALILLICLLVLPRLFAAPLDDKRAEAEIRSFLKRQATLQNMAGLRAAGRSTPEAGAARRWQSELERLERTEFVSIEIKHLLFVPPFTSSRFYVARATLRDPRDPERVDEVRFFSLSADNHFFDFFWVSEQSRLMWLLSI